MTKINHSKGNVVTSEEIYSFSFKSNEQAFEFINPCERSFYQEARIVDLLIKKSFAASFRLFPVASVFRYVRDNAMIEADSSGFFGIKGHISVEKTTFNHQSQMPDLLKQFLHIFLQLERIIMISAIMPVVPMMYPFPSVTGKMFEVFAFFRP